MGKRKEVEQPSKFTLIINVSMDPVKFTMIIKSVLKILSSSKIVVTSQERLKVKEDRKSIHSFDSPSTLKFDELISFVDVCCVKKYYSLQQEDSHMVLTIILKKFISYQLLILRSHIIIKIHNNLFVLVKRITYRI